MRPSEPLADPLDTEAERDIQGLQEHPTLGDLLRVAQEDIRYRSIEIPWEGTRAIGYCYNRYGETLFELHGYAKRTTFGDDRALPQAPPKVLLITRGPVVNGISAAGQRVERTFAKWIDIGSSAIRSDLELNVIRIWAWIEKR